MRSAAPLEVSSIRHARAIVDRLRRAPELPPAWGDRKQAAALGVCRGEVAEAAIGQLEWRFAEGRASVPSDNMIAFECLDTATVGWTNRLDFVGPSTATNPTCRRLYLSVE